MISYDEDKNRFALGHYVDKPDKGVTFALPQVDVPKDFKRLVLAHLSQMDWSKYYKRPDEAINKGPFGWAQEYGLYSHFSAGAEAAMISYAQQLQPTVILCPKYSYPGYLRLARVVSARIEAFSSLEDLLIKLSKNRETVTLTIITIPGNPLDSRVSPDTWGDILGTNILIDAAYEPPDTELFKNYAVNAARCEAPIVHSMAKSYPLAGLRLGGLMSIPGHLGAQFVEHRFWNILSCAVMEVLANPTAHDLLLSQREYQRLIRDQMIEKFSKLGYYIFGCQSDLFLTVEYDSKLLKMEHKSYNYEFMRIDCNIINLKYLERLNETL